MGEFLEVAKDLEIKKICKTVDSYAPTEETEKYINEDNTIQANIDKYNNTERDRCDTEGIPDQSESKFPQQGSIRKHIHIQHEFVKYSCHQYDYQAAWQDNLMAHIQSKHEGIKFICDQCKQKFASKGNLKSHIQSRHEGLMYACDQCGQQYKQKYDLNSHINSK